MTQEEITISRKAAEHAMLDPVAKLYEPYIKKTIYVYLYEQMIEMFCAGAQWQKEQMLKGAVDSVVDDAWEYGKDPDKTMFPTVKVRTPDFVFGDKVKVIIIKEGGEE